MCVLLSEAMLFPALRDRNKEIAPQGCSFSSQEGFWLVAKDARPALLAITFICYDTKQKESKAPTLVNYQEVCHAAACESASGKGKAWSLLLPLRVGAACPQFPSFLYLPSAGGQD